MDSTNNLESRSFEFFLTTKYIWSVCFIEGIRFLHLTWLAKIFSHISLFCVVLLIFSRNIKGRDYYHPIIKGTEPYHDNYTFPQLQLFGQQPCLACIRVSKQETCGDSLEEYAMIFCSFFSFENRDICQRPFTSWGLP